MPNLKFPKPKKVKRPVKGLNKVRKTPLAVMKRQADKLAGELCRARGKCEICGSTKNLQWAHVLSRRYHNIRWKPQNAICLCRECHCRYTYNPDLWMEYLLTNYRDTLDWLIGERQKETKINRQFMEDTLYMLKNL